MIWKTTNIQCHHLYLNNDGPQQQGFKQHFQVADDKFHLHDLNLRAEGKWGMQFISAMKYRTQWIVFQEVHREIYGIELPRMT